MNKLFLFTLMVITCFLFINMVYAYDNPTTKVYSWDDGAANAIFDIKTDKKTYSNLTNEIVYYKVTNLTNAKHDLNIQVFFSENVTINYFGEWTDVGHVVQVYTNTPTNVTVYVKKADLNFGGGKKADLNFGGGCVGNGYLDFNSSHCYFINPTIVRTVSNEVQTYPDWKKSKAKAWQTKPSQVHANMSHGRALNTINIGKNETKYFVLDFSHKPNTSGEFYLCGNNDCLDPFWDMSWLYKRQLTITNNNSGTILKDNNNAIKVRITTELGAKALANCNDVRIIKGEVLELDRNIIGNCQSDANIYFELPTQIAAGGTDNNYWVYYGNAAATAPTNPTNLSLTGLDSTTNYLYRFDYGYLDSIVNSNVLVDAGTVGKTGAYNKGANSVELTNGTNKYLVTTNTSPLTNPPDFSIDFFIMLTAQPGVGDYWWLASTADATQTEGWDLIYHNDGGTYKFLIRTFVSTPAEEYISVTQTLTVGTWYHIQYTYDSSTGIKFYVNGTNKGGSATTTKYTSNQNQKLYIGNDGRGVNNAYTPSAYIDEFRVRSAANQNYFAQADMNATLQTTTALGAEETQPSYTINFNIYRTATASHLTNVRMDCNNTSYSLTGQNSPFTQNIVVDKNILCSFARPGYNDSNNNIVVADANLKTYTFYLSDTTAPSVGLTTLTGFTEYDSGTQKYFKGTGHIVGGAATDAGSGIDNTTCEMQYFDGGLWSAGLWDGGGFCYSANFTAANTTDYNFNTRVKDLAANQGTGTATDSYIGDSTAPTTTLSVLGGGYNYTSFRLTCSDAGSGCKSTWYKSDSNAWVVDTTTIDFNVFGIGSHTIYYNSSDNLDTNETLKTYDFNIFGNVRLNFYNEVSGVALTDVNVTFNSVVHNTGATYFVDVNLQGITQNTYTFTLSKTGYSTRYYQIDLNQLMDLNKSFALILNTLDTDISFTFYKPDQTTLYANTFIEFWDMDTNYIIGRLKTNALGQATFNLRINDSNYYQNVNNNEYLYNPVSLTIYYPINEETFAQIDGNWQINLTQNSFSSYTELDSNQVIYLMPNTTSGYILRISDMNGNYFARNYVKQYKGNPLTDTLQPYLVSILTGLLTTIRTVSGYTNQPIPGVNIKIYKDLTPGFTLVEEIVTDDKGEALVLMVTGDLYYFDIYYNGVFLRRDEITATSSTIYVRIDDLIYTPPLLENISASVNFYPAYSKLSLVDKNLVQVININDFNSSLLIQKIHIKIINTDVNGVQGNDVNLLSWTMIYADENSITHNFNLNSLGHTIEGVAYDTNGYLKVLVIIETSDTNYTAFFNYKPYTGLDPIYEFGFGSRALFGCESYYDEYGNPNPLIPCPNQLFIALFISFICVASISVVVRFTNPAGLGIIFMGIMGIFAFLTFVPIVLYGLMVAAGVVVIIVSRGRFN